MKRSGPTGNKRQMIISGGMSAAPLDILPLDIEIPMTEFFVESQNGKGKRLWATDNTYHSKALGRPVRVWIVGTTFRKTIDLRLPPDVTFATLDYLILNMCVSNPSCGKIKRKSGEECIDLVEHPEKHEWDNDSMSYCLWRDDIDDYEVWSPYSREHTLSIKKC